MKYIITGATGFIGSEFVKYALTQDAVVYAVCRKGSKGINRLPLHRNLRVIYSSLGEYGNLLDTIKCADVFVNFAWGAISREGRDNTEIQLENIKHSEEAMNIAKKLNCCLFIETGSQAEYGEVLDTITENTPCNPFSDYGKSKLELQKRCFSLSEKIGIKYLHLRIFSVYGENDHPWTLLSSIIPKLKLNQPVDLSLCTQKWNFLYVRDAVKQIFLLSQYAIDNDTLSHEIYHIANDDTRTLKDYIIELRDLCHSTSMLNFGAIVPTYNVSLDPDMSKTRYAINFVSDYKFADGINIILNNKRYER